MSNIFMSTENSKTTDPNIFRLYFTDRIDLRGNKKIALSDLPIHYTWHNTQEKYNNNKFRLSGPTWSEDVTILTFRIKTGNKLELLSNETMRLLGAGPIIDTTKMVKMFQN